MSTVNHWMQEKEALGQIPIAHALSVLGRAPSGVRVLGADGFTATNHPALDFIADFSRLTMSAEESVRAAIDTLLRWPSELLVELVMSDK